MTDETTVSLADFDDEKLLQAAVLADAMLAIKAAVDYGFLAGGPAINAERCEDAIAVARERGLTWTDEQRTETAVRFLAGWNARQEAGGA
jgi:hypothetical protein